MSKCMRADRVHDIPGGDVPLFCKLTEEPDGTPFVVYAVSDAHPALEHPGVLVALWVRGHLEFKGVAVPEMFR